MEKSLERELILLLIDRHSFNKKRCLELLDSQLDWEYVLGYLTYNRVAGIAYENILKYNPYEDNINREFRLGLFLVHNIQALRTKVFQKYIIQIEDILNKKDIPHAFLKGAILSNSIYPEGCRISNDVDLLISEDHLKQATHALNDLEFIQGTYDILTNSIIPATRKEILHCRLNFGELMSFIRIVDEPGVNMILVDVNFSLEAHGIDNKEAVNRYLKNLEKYLVIDKEVTSLSREYFLLHLCVHFFKEATDLRWVQKQRDMSLYKIIDIYEVLCSGQLNLSNLKELIELEGVQKEVYYTLKITSDIFNSLMDQSFVREFLEKYKSSYTKDMAIVTDVSNPSQIYSLEMSTIDRIFEINRADRIKLEVNNMEQSIEIIINKLIEEVSSVNGITVNKESDLRKDLGFDSLSMVELLVNLEEKFDIEFNENYLNPELFNKVADLYKMTQKHLVK